MAEPLIFLQAATQTVCVQIIFVSIIKVHLNCNELSQLRQTFQDKQPLRCCRDRDQVPLLAIGVSGAIKKTLYFD